MTRVPKYYAVLYVIDLKDGSEKVSIPCFNEDQVRRFGSKYPKVLVKMPDGVRFWLSFKQEWRDEFLKNNPIQNRNNLPLEWLREPSSPCDEVVTCYGPKREYAVLSDICYDGWGRYKASF